MKLLLIDDDAFLRDMYAVKFEEAGHTITVAENGNDALAALDREPFDVILMDMIMPGLSGVALLERIKAHKHGKDAMCIVLSNQGEQEDIDAAQAAGAAGYIIKAESIPSQVIAKVEELAGA